MLGDRQAIRLQDDGRHDRRASATARRAAERLLDQLGVECLDQHLRRRRPGHVGQREHPEPEPNGTTCRASANLPHAIPLNPGGYFSFADFPPQTSIQGGFSFGGQLLQSGGTAAARVGLCDGVDFHSLKAP